jgi:hypothetical protein
MVTRCRLDNRGFIPGRGPTYRETLWRILPLMQWVPRVLSPGVKRPGRDQIDRNCDICLNAEESSLP